MSGGEDANNATMRTFVDDEGQCHVHLGDLIDWLQKQGNYPAASVADLFREAGRFWAIRYEEGLS